MPSYQPVTRSIKHRLVADGFAHAALIYDDDRAVAWAECGSPEELPDISSPQGVRGHCRATPDYLVTRILVERGLRGQGLAAIALSRSRRPDRARRRRPGRGLPPRHRRDPEEELVVPLNVTRTIYEREGFTYERPKGHGNGVMVREVAPTPDPQAGLASVLGTQWTPVGRSPIGDPLAVRVVSVAVAARGPVRVGTLLARTWRQRSVNLRTRLCPTD